MKKISAKERRKQQQERSNEIDKILVYWIRTAVSAQNSMRRTQGLFVKFMIYLIESGLIRPTPEELKKVNDYIFEIAEY